jgi:hypothetical protein
VNPERARQAYPALEDRIRKAFLDHDPDQLLALGAPTDEYDGDIHALISALTTATGVADVESIIETRYRDAPERGGLGSRETWQAMASQVWQAWVAFKRAAD